MQIIRHTRTERKLDGIAGSESSFLEPPGDSLSTLSPGSPAAAVWSSGLASWAGLAGSAWWAGVVGLTGRPWPLSLRRPVPSESPAWSRGPRWRRIVWSPGLDRGMSSWVVGVVAAAAVLGGGVAARPKAGSSWSACGGGPHLPFTVTRKRCPSFVWIRCRICGKVPRAVSTWRVLTPV